MANTLVIDQGTHATRAIVFDEQGEPIECRQTDITLQYLDHARVEQDAGKILQSVYHVLQRLDKKLLGCTDRCAITTQRSTMVAWDRNNGTPLHPAISWQDRRSQPLMDRLAERAARVEHITGLPLSAHYGAGKIRWLLTQVDAVHAAQAQGRLCIAPLSGFLLHRLLAHSPSVLDHSNAHRTLLFDIERLDWSMELATLFDIPVSILPACKPVIHDYGNLAPLDIHVTAVCGDQTAALYAQGEWQPGSAFINLGTGAFILSPMDRPVHIERLLCSVGKTDHRRDNHYLLEATVNGAGAALSWAQQAFPVHDLYDQLDSWLQCPRGSPPLFLNTVGGLGSPWWKSGGEPRFIGLHDHGIKDRYIAVIESIVFLLVNNLDRMRQALRLERLYVSGGLAQLDGLCQRLADLSALPVYRPAHIEATARGGAWLARDCPADWPVPPLNKIFTPRTQPELRQAYEEFNQEIGKL